MLLHEQLMSLPHWLRGKGPAPAGLKPERLAVYQELVNNNIASFIDVTFPITRSLLSEALWLELKQQFVCKAYCHSPFFYDISRQFMDWVLSLEHSELVNLPWLAELLHVEWMELAVELAPDVATSKPSPSINLYQGGDPLIAPAVPVWVLAYQWPIHRWHKDHSDFEHSPTFLLVYRHQETLSSMQAELTASEACLWDILVNNQSEGMHFSELLTRCSALLPEALALTEPQAKSCLERRQLEGLALSIC